MNESSDETKLALIRESLSRMEKDAEDFEQKLEKKFDEYVLKLVFESFKEHIDTRIRPLERIVYGMVGLILIAVITALIATVVTT
jgi:hypothetical protein